MPSSAWKKNHSSSRPSRSSPPRHGRDPGCLHLQLLLGASAALFVLAEEMGPLQVAGCFFFFNDTATTEIYTLSLHDALPILRRWRGPTTARRHLVPACPVRPGDRKSTRLNSSHGSISYAVLCLKKKKNKSHAAVPEPVRPARLRRRDAQASR